LFEITTIRASAFDDAHDHVELVGYISAHIDEPIMIDADRIATRISLGESFGVKVGDEMAEVKPGPCPVCNEPGQIRSSKDTKQIQHLLSLPRT
jgi:hypothetical protein